MRFINLYLKNKDYYPKIAFLCINEKIVVMQNIKK